MAQILAPLPKSSRAEYYRNWQRANKEKVNKYLREWRAKNPERFRAIKRRYYLKNKEKISVVQRARARKLWLDPDYRFRRYYLSRKLPVPTRERPATCECCGRACNKLLLDHCHSSGIFRGWICGNCNRGLGLLGDSLDSLRKVIAYLERP